MSLPYRWRPMGTRYGHAEPIKPGDLLPFEHQVWRVIEIRPLPESDWTDKDRAVVTDSEHYRPDFREEYLARNTPRVMEIRPITAPDDVRGRDQSKHYLLGGRNRYHSWDVYEDEHYPICAACREPLPCREQMSVEVSEAAMTRMTRYETAGVCPACQEVVTARQKSMTWPDNLEVLQGPPVTFHLRGRCLGSAVSYEERWVAADPGRRRAHWSCAGHVINHNDGTFQCTELTECPGPQARHPSYTVCRCVDCHARGIFGCTPARDARNQALDFPEGSI